MTEEQAAVAARKSGKQVEVLSQRGETRETYALPAGGFVATEHLRPVRTLKAGRWVGLDVTLKRNPVDGSISPLASTVGLRFSGGGTGPMATLRRGAKQLALSWPEKLPAPVLDGDTAVYASVLPDVDLRLRADVDGFSHVLVVKTPQAAKNPRLAKLELGLSAPGLRVSADARGFQSVVDLATGGEVFQAPEPQMWDSTQPSDLTAAPTASPAPKSAVRPAGAAPLARPVTRELAASPGSSSRVARMRVNVARGKETLVPDQKLLTSTDTRFPLYLDPLWDTPQDSHRLMVGSNGDRAYDFKDDEGMGDCPIDLPPAGAYCNDRFVKRLFYQMPTSRFVGKHILSAEFQVKETWSASCTTRAVRIYRAKPFGKTSTWSSTSDNWVEHLDTQDVAKGQSSSCPAGDVIFNVTKGVADASRYGWSATAFGLRAYDEGDQYGWKRFADQAFLRVHYNSTPNKPAMKQLSMSPGGPCSSKTTPMNRVPTLYAGNLTDPDASKAVRESLRAQFYVAWTDPATNTAKHWSSIQGPKSSGTNMFSVPIPQSTIPQGVTLSWGVRVSDVTDDSDWSAWSWVGSSRCYFLYDTRALPEPTITSSAADGYTKLDDADSEATAQDGIGRYGRFNLAFDARVAKYSYALNTDAGTPSITVPSSHAVAIDVMPSRKGINQLYVAACDAANNCSQDVYPFWVKDGSDPVARWKMDEAAGATQLADTADKTNGGDSYPAATAGTVTLGNAGVVDTAMNLPGTYGSYAATSGKVVSTDKSFAVAAWIKPGFTAPGDRPIVSQDGSRGSVFTLYYNQSAGSYGSYGFKMSDPGSDTPAVVRAEYYGGVYDQWVHVAGVYDATKKQIRLYVNGQLKQEVAQPNGWVGDGPLSIGRSKSKGIYNGVYFKGGIDDVQVYGRVLSGDEAARLFTVKPQLRGRWRVNTKSATTPATSPDSMPWIKHDLTLSGNAGIATGDPNALIGPDDGVAGALDLPGAAGDYASVLTKDWLDTGQSFTISAWVHTTGTALTKSMQLFSLAGAANNAIAVRFDAATQHYVLDIADSDKAGVQLWNIPHSSFHQGSYMDWDNIVVSYDAFASTVTLYVNGNAERAAGDPADPDAPDTPVSYREQTRVFTPVKSLELGRTITGGNNLTGQIDDMWVMQGAVDDGQATYFSYPAEIEIDGISPAQDQT